jgi:microcystin degradation protein MlrC
MRIGVIGLSIEVLLRSPIAIEMGAIQMYSPREMRNNNLWLVRGVLDRLGKETDVEVVPLLWATALPGGQVSRLAYDNVKSESVRRLAAAGPLDGLVVANHGSLEVEGVHGNGDADYVGALRKTTGPDVPISVALDLHGAVTLPLLQAANVFSALRTAPHRDDHQTGCRAADQLLRVIGNRLRPKTAAVRIPILVPGEAAMTDFPPADELYAGLAEIDARPGIMEANIFVGFAWNDLPWTGMTAIVTHETDIDVARRTAQDLAARIWQRRHEFRLRMEIAQTRVGLLAANTSRVRPVYISDAGDNTTAGAPGDLTWVLQEALNIRIEDAVVLGIFAPKAVLACLSAGAGATVRLELGSEHVSGAKQILAVDAIVEAAGQQLELDGFQPYRNTEGPWARIRLGQIVATLHGAPIGITTPAHLKAMGIDPTAHRIYVVKVGYLHPQLEDIAARHLLLISEGSSHLDMHRLDWHRVIRPMHPLDTAIQWTPEQSTFDNVPVGHGRGAL